MDLIMFPQNSYGEALTLNVTIFGDRALNCVIRLKEVIRMEVQSCKKFISVVYAT